jgi:NADPH:quinone reductase-like Zn-dependent oxidoreductase
MRAVVIDEFGSADRLHLRDMPTPEPGDNEVLIEIAYTSVNPVDWMIREGYLQGRMPHKFPLIPGWDAAGVVKARGKEVVSFREGQQVYAYCRKSEIQHGTYAEYIALDQDSVAHAPRTIGLKEAASIPLAGLTAWQALFNAAELKQGESVLIQGGAGGVGSFAVQFAKATGARVFATGLSRHHGYLMNIGADMAIDYSEEDVVQAVREVTPQGVDVVLDLVGGSTQSNSYPALKAGGRLVSTVNPPDPATAAKHSVKSLYIFVQPSGPDLRAIAQLIDGGRIKPPRLEEYPLERAAEAQRQSESHHVEGKIVLRVK